jgi:hypothetical protein
MGSAPRALLAGGLGVAASFVVACGGGSGLLNADQANSLNSQLDQVSSAVDAGQCNAAADAVTTFSNAVINLPPSVSATLTNNLKQGASTVAQLAAKDCQSQTTTTTSSSTTSSSTTSSTPTTTTTTSSPTTTTNTPTTTSSNTTPTTTSSATSTTGSGTTSTTGGSGGAGLGGSGTGGGGGSGTGGNGNSQ